MKRTSIVAAVLVVALPSAARAQVGGNVSYAETGARPRAEGAERARHTLTQQELPPDKTSTYVDANVLMNVKADEYVAVFAVAQEGADVADCGRKMDARLRSFAADLKEAGVPGIDVFVDFVAQNRVYGYEISGDVAKERLVGFELKKNVSVHYFGRDLLDRLVVAAAKSEIFDLVKVDYIVKDHERAQERLVEEAARIIKKKASRYEKLLGIRLQPPGQVIVERAGVTRPSRMYDSYTAAESEAVTGGFDRARMTVQGARKGRTFFFNALDGDGFDAVIDPVILEPVVQFTLYLKVKYEVEPVKAK